MITDLPQNNHFFFHQEEYNPIAYLTNKYERPIEIREYIERKEYKGYKEENHQTIVANKKHFFDTYIVIPTGMYK